MSERRTTLDRDTERRVAEWLAHGPDELPEHVLQDVIQRTAFTRQTRRRWLGRWLDRDEGVRGAASERPIDGGGRGNLLLSLASVTAVLALLVMTIGFVRTAPTAPAAGGYDLVVASDGSGDYSTIQEAVTVAEAGAVVAVRPGRYEGPVTVDKDIRLVGDGARSAIVVVAPSAGSGTGCCGEEVDRPHALLLDAGAVTVSDLVIEVPADGTGIEAISGSPLIERVSIVRRGPGTPDDDGHYSMGFYGPTAPVIRASEWDGYVAVRFGAAATFEGNTVSRGGLSIDGPGVSTVRGNTFIDGAWVNTTSAVATVTGNVFTDGDVSADVGSDIVIRDNTFRDGPTDLADAAIVIRGRQTHAAIEANTVMGASRGVSVTEDASATIRGNDIDGTSTGILVAGSGDIVLEANRIGGEGTGIQLVFSAAPTITGNTISVDGTGISVGRGTAPVISGNSVCGGSARIKLLEGATPVLGTNELCAAGSPG